MGADVEVRVTMQSRDVWKLNLETQSAGWPVEFSARLVDPEAVLRQLLGQRLMRMSGGELATVDRAFASYVASVRAKNFKPVAVNTARHRLLSLLAPASPEEGTNGK